MIGDLIIGVIATLVFVLACIFELIILRPLSVVSLPDLIENSMYFSLRQIGSDNLLIMLAGHKVFIIEDLQLR